MKSCQSCNTAVRRRTRVGNKLLCTRCAVAASKPVTPTQTPVVQPTTEAEASTLAQKLSANMALSTNGKPHHAVVRAYAGTGKTFSQIMGVAWAYARNRWDDIQRGLALQINRKAGFDKVDRIARLSAVRSMALSRAFDSRRPRLASPA